MAIDWKKRDKWGTIYRNFRNMNKLKQQSLDSEDERNRLDFIDLELEIKT